MKILWFTNTPCAAAEKLGAESNRGGWLKSLEHEISNSPGVELCISFYSATELEPFKYNSTYYHPVFRKSNRSKISRYLKRITGKLKDDKVEIELLLQVIDQVKPDLIHIHGTEENFGLIQAKTRLPVVISIQGILTPYIEKFYAGVSSSAASRYEKFFDKINFKSACFIHKNMAAKVEREKQIYKLSGYVIGRTDWDRRVAKVLAPAGKYFYNSEIMRTVFYEAVVKKSAFNKCFTIVTISSDALYKGFEMIVQTAMILSSYTALKFTWIVIGLSENTGIVSLIKRMMRIELTNISIKLVGSLNELEILKMLNSADVYCQVSHIENSPNSLCEAMLTGIPVVASYAGGTSSLIDNGVDGLIVQDGDPYSLSGTILEIASDFNKSSQYGVNARVKALRRHDKGTITNGLLNIYRTILDEKKLALC